MVIILWILIFSCFIVSFIGLVYPVIPSIVMIWGGVAIYHFLISQTQITGLTWNTLFFFTLLILVMDYMASIYFVKRYGGSKRAMRSAAFGVLIGCFVIPPFGVLVVPFILVLLTEFLQEKSLTESINVAFGTLFAFLSSAFAKAVIQLVMIIIFMLNVVR